MTQTTELWHNASMLKNSARHYQGANMNAHILNKYGFKQISVAEAQEDNQEKPVVIPINVSIIRPQDHINPQLVVKFPREQLSQLKWEISDRVNVLANPSKNTIALVKTSKNDKNSFAISTQGASVEAAKIAKRGGVVKVGWRPELTQEISGHGTYTASLEIFEKSAIVKLPVEMFA